MLSIHRLRGAALLLFPAVACAQAPATGSRDRLITEALMRSHVNVIADDSMLGRDTPSAGLEKTANYVAAHFKRLGLKPGGDNDTFIQRYPLSPGRSNGTAPSPGTFDPNSAPNTVGILPGTDPALRDEYIVISAHMDHVGVNPASKLDSIWNGADDDASGTAGVLALAEALAADPPRRSVIFLTVSGEEKGLYGSRWFVENSPVPVTQLVANLNLDMIGRNWMDSIVVIGMQHSTLGATVKNAARSNPAVGLTVSDDLWPQESFFTRSDHYNFARRGVPALFFFNGTHEDYHRPGDSPDKIDAEKAARVVQLVYHTTVAVANAPRRPEWDAESRRKIVERP
jgi:Zn-dependent M28 family amino/carboxypeptidase